MVTETPGQPLPPAGRAVGPSGPTGPGDVAPSGASASPPGPPAGGPVFGRPAPPRPGPIPAALLALGARPTGSSGVAAASGGDSAASGSGDPRLTPDGLPKLLRLRDRGVLGGVAAGISVHLRVPVVWVRVVFALLALMGGAGVIAYALLWIFVPPATPAAPAAGRAPPNGVRPTASPRSAWRC